MEVNVLRVSKKGGGYGRKLANHFGAYEVTSKFKPKRFIRDGARILNYGSSNKPVWYDDVLSRGCRFINHPYAVALSVDKIKTFKALDGAGVPTLEWTADIGVAQGWLIEDDKAVMVRHTTTGSCGKGTEPFGPGDLMFDELPAAPLYTTLFDKTHEFRVFVVNGKAVDLIQKKRMGKKKLEEKGLTEANMDVRNYNNGWVFAHKDLICDMPYGRRDTLENLGVNAIQALGLDWGAVDILARYDANGKWLAAVVCEVNSAPALDAGTTWERVVGALTTMMGV